MQQNGKKRITLSDIAKKANVSTSTVSRVLNNHPHVDEETRLLVRQFAEMMDYPLTSLRATTTAIPSVAILSRTMEVIRTSMAGVEDLMARGIQEVMDARGVPVFLRRTYMTQDNVDSLRDDPSIGGAILLGGMVEHDFIRWLQAADIPFVIAGSHVQPLQTNAVMADIRAGVEQAIAHLVTRGRRCIGMVNGNTITNTSQEKYRALRLGLTLHDLPFSARQHVYGDFSAEAGYRDTLRLLDQMPDVDAILYGDDNEAMGGLRALKERGRRVPDDVAIIGFHGYEMAKFTEPPLTSIEFDMEVMGRVAARRLLDMLDEPDDDNLLTLIPTRLVIRGSA
jgi:DNA-binding LacI/PurR family transcriptional regulator